MFRLPIIKKAPVYREAVAAGNRVRPVFGVQRGER
jgi:hypothetical protein